MLISRSLSNLAGSLRRKIRTRVHKGYYKKIVPFDNFKQLMEMVDKQNKFQSISLICQENSKKDHLNINRGDFPHEAERNQLIETIFKGKQQIKTDRFYKIAEIQGEKEQLFRQINVLQGKITDLKESSIGDQSGASFDHLNNVQALVNQSMMSQKQEDLHGQTQPKGVLLDNYMPKDEEQQQFDIKNEMNESLLFEKEQQDVIEHQNQSIISEDNKEKHHIFDFGQFSEHVNSSICSQAAQNKEKEENQPQMSFEDFEQWHKNNRTIQQCQTQIQKYVINVSDPKNEKTLSIELDNLNYFLLDKNEEYFYMIDQIQIEQTE